MQSLDESINVRICWKFDCLCCDIIPLLLEIRRKKTVPLGQILNIQVNHLYYFAFFSPWHSAHEPKLTKKYCKYRSNDWSDTKNTERMKGRRKLCSPMWIPLLEIILFFLSCFRLRHTSYIVYAEETQTQE